LVHQANTYTSWFASLHFSSNISLSITLQRLTTFMLAILLSDSS
jgi:hypothetical protein